MDDVSVDKVDLMQDSKIETAVYLNKLGVWSFEFRVIKRADNETRNVHEFCLDVQNLRTILQLGFDAMGRCTIRKKSSREAQEEVVPIVYRLKKTHESTPIRKLWLKVPTSDVKFDSFLLQVLLAFLSVHSLQAFILELCCRQSFLLLLYGIFLLKRGLF